MMSLQLRGAIKHSSEFPCHDPTSEGGLLRYIIVSICVDTILRVLA